VAHVRNLDTQGGRTTAPNLGESVTSLDINPVQAAIGQPYEYMYDFDGNFIVNSLDLNMVKGHKDHHCSNMSTLIATETGFIRQQMF